MDKKELFELLKWMGITFIIGLTIGGFFNPVSFKGAVQCDSIITQNIYTISEMNASNMTHELYKINYLYEIQKHTNITDYNQSMN